MVGIEDGQLLIRQEGSVRKFRSNVEQITFSGDMARQRRQRVLFITERAVFILAEEGLLLTEIAPGIELERDIFPMMGFRPEVADPLLTMDQRIFCPTPIGLNLA